MNSLSAPINKHLYCMSMALTLSCGAEYAQALQFENLSIKEGLSQSSVYDIAQDKTGYLWLATNDGLNRYDGKQFIQFSGMSNTTQNTSIAAREVIYDIFIDANNDVWTGSNLGLIYLNSISHTSKIYRNDPNDKASLSDNLVRSIATDSEGMLWIATNDGLNRFNPKTEKFQRYFSDKAELKTCTTLLRSIVVDKNGYIWMGGSNNKLCRFDPKNKIFSLIDYRNNHKESINTGLRSVFEDSEGYVWVGSTNGLFRFNPNSGESRPYFFTDENLDTQTGLNWIQRITEYEKHYIWAATSGGIIRIDKKTGGLVTFINNKYKKNGPNWREYFSIYIDRSGLIWLGSSGAGLDKLNPKQDSFNLLDDFGKPGYALSNPSIWSVQKTAGYVWIATTAGMNRYDPQTKKIKAYLNNPNDPHSLPYNQVNAIVPGKNQDLWVATQNGLSHFDIKSEKFENFFHDEANPNSIPDNIIIDIMVDNKGLFWISSFQSGIFVFDPNSKKTIKQFKHDSKQPESLKSNSHLCSFQSSDGLIWLGTLAGLSIYDPVTESLHSYPLMAHENPNIPIDIKSIAEAKDMKMLFGSSYGLLVHDRKTGETKIYDTRNGLGNDSVYRIEQDKQGYIWVSTNRGISKIDLTTGKIRNYDLIDGLQGYEFNAGASHNDGEYLYFGGYNGLTFFKPELVNFESLTPPVAITSFKTNETSVQTLNFTKPINLGYKDNFFSVEFSVLDYTNPGKNQYAYMLEGFDKDWIYSGNRSFAAYTNLDGGNYRFRIKGANKYEHWNHEGAALVINIDLPPWRRWWAYVLYLSAFLSILFFAIRFKFISDSRGLADKIRRMSTSLAQTLDPETVYTETAKHLKEVLAYERIMIFTKHASEFKKVFDAHSDSSTEHPISLQIEEKILAYTSNTQRPFYLNSAADYKTLNIALEYQVNFNIMCLPLITRQNIIGAILLMSPKNMPFQPNNIDIAVTLGIHASAAIDNARLFSETKHLFEETKQLAFYDTLTGLENRRLFKEQLDQTLKRIERSQKGIAVFFLDLDQFKQINDTLGHDVGDALLIEIAKRLKGCVRSHDSVARIGGDEFTILLNDVNDPQTASIVAEKIIKTFEKPVIIGTQQIKTSTSIGISLAPKDTIDPTTLMKNADVAMYNAKEAGRNNYQFFTQEMNIELMEHLAIKNDLKLALDENHFQLYYQPIYSMSTLDVDGAEGLIRWIHPVKGMIQPDVFIPRAEETHLINDIGRWVFQAACQHQQYLQSRNIKKVVLSTNLSMNQIMYDPYLVESMTEAIQQFKVDPILLRLEITENIFVKNYQKIVKILYRLRDLGMTLAIDDFGTGYSSFSYLKQLPIDIIKIDRSFVSDIPKDIEDCEITAAIIAMAHKLRLKVVAEGVETREQLMFLEKNACDFAQGYLFSKPIEFEQFLNFLQQRPAKRLSIVE